MTQPSVDGGERWCVCGHFGAHGDWCSACERPQGWSGDWPHNPDHPFEPQPVDGGCSGCDGSGYGNNGVCRICKGTGIEPVDGGEAQDAPTLDELWDAYCFALDEGGANDEREARIAIEQRVRADLLHEVSEAHRPLIEAARELRQAMRTATIAGGAPYGGAWKRAVPPAIDGVLAALGLVEGETPHG